MRAVSSDNRGFLKALAGDGRPLLSLTGLCLILAGAFACFQAGTGHLLPHDEQFLGLSARHLCGINQCRIVHFMIHDRVSFGGVIIAIGVFYLWLAEFPLRRGEAWAWWLFMLSGWVGFGSFFAYFGFGYLDAWHAVATFALLVCFIAGLLRSFRVLRGPIGMSTLLRRADWGQWTSRLGAGRLLFLLCAIGMIVAGCTILYLGMTSVFVPQDLEYMGMTAGELHAINPRLVPLIAHDRAGFGGGVACAGVLLLFAAWCARPSRSLWQAFLLAGVIGYGAAIGVHPAVGYTDALHLAPAVVGATVLGVGLVFGRDRRNVTEASVATALNSRSPQPIHAMKPAGC